MDNESAAAAPPPPLPPPPPPLPPVPVPLPPALASCNEYPKLTDVENERRTNLMESIRGGKVALRSTSESRAKQREREAASMAVAGRGPAAGGSSAVRGRGNQDLMRDLSSQLKMRGGPRSGQLLRSGRR